MNFNLWTPKLRIFNLWSPKFNKNTVETLALIFKPLRERNAENIEMLKND